jgi:hypothetical protein
MRVGRRRTVTAQARADWHREREAEAAEWQRQRSASRPADKESA